MKKTFFISVLISFVIPSFKVWADNTPPISGSCAKANTDSTCTWSFNTSSGTLTISGTGAMNDYSYATAPWFGNRETITNVVVENGITRIGNKAFERLLKVTEVSIPETVTNIGNFAFYAMTNIKNIVIPDSVTNIERGAFWDVHYSSSIVVGKNVSSIEDNAFRDTPAKVYCPQGSEVCAVGIGSITEDKIIYYTKDTITGIYKLGDRENETYYLSADDMIAFDTQGNHTGSCGTLAQCQASVLKTKGKCDTDSACLALANEAKAGTFLKGGKFYASLNDYILGNHIKKRIYTIDEANLVTGPVNRVSITYR